MGSVYNNLQNIYSLDLIELASFVVNYNKTYYVPKIQTWQIIHYCKNIGRTFKNSFYTNYKLN